MIHKFHDYDKNEKREIVFEIIKQKYLHNPTLNNFSNNSKYMIDAIKKFEGDIISETELKQKLDYFYSKVSRTVAEEMLFYFYNIAEVTAERFPNKKEKFTTISNIIQDIIDVEAISNTIVPPEDKMGSIDNDGAFSIISYSKYPSPKSYVAPPPPPPLHNFTNPYTSNSYKTICDYLRYKIFELLIDNEIETIEGLEDISLPELIPDSDEVVNFPQVKIDGEKEDLDFENYGEFIINNENSITFGGGGDWQNPKTFDLTVQGGKIKAINIHNDYNEGDYGAKAILKVICELFGLSKKDYNVNSDKPNDLKKLYDDMVDNKNFKIGGGSTITTKSSGKITTEDCVDAIVNYFPNESAAFRNIKNWKRKSKTGSGVYIRIFENKVTGDLVKVTSTETEITDIKKM